MAESSPVPASRKFLIGSLAALIVVAIAVSAAAVLWFTVLEDHPVTEFIRAGDGGDGRSASRSASSKAEDDQTVLQQQETDSEQEVLPIPQEINLVGIIPSPRIVTLNGPEQSQPLTVQGFYSDGSTGDLPPESRAEFSYTSSDPEVAQVSPNGFITSLKAGGADITVTYGDFDAEVPVLVWGEVRQIPPIDPNRLLEVDEDGTAIVLNRVMAELELGYGPADADELAVSIGGKVIFEFLTFPGFLIEFDASTPEEMEEALAALNDNWRVSVAYPDLVLATSQAGANIETLQLRRYFNQAYIDAGMADAWNTMNLVASFNSLYPVNIAMIDVGFVTMGPKFNNVLSLEFDRSKIHVVGTPSANVHGTQVASVMIAQNNSIAATTAIGVNGASFSGVVTSVNGT